MSLPPRYLPMPADVNATYHHQGHQALLNISGPAVPAWQGPRQPLEALWILASALYAAIVALAVLYTLRSIPGPGRRGSATIFAGAGEGSARDVDEGYTYHGVKLLLREALLRMRKRMSCPRCTPRELIPRGAPEGFALLYEAVVYGDKQIPGALERARVLGEGEGP